MATYVIVGNGVTGTRAAEVLRRKDSDSSIILVTEEEYPFYRRPQLPDFAAGKVAGAALWGKRSQFYDDQELEVRLSSRVASVDPDKGEVQLEGGDTLGYDGLLVATGRRLHPGRIQGADLSGTNCLKTLDEAKAIREADGSGRTAVVAGDGMMGFEMVRALTGAGYETTYYVPGERLWPDVLDEDAAAIAADRIRSSGAELVTGSPVEALSGSDGAVESVVLADGTEVRADLYGVCMGYRPAVDFLPGDVPSLTPNGSYATEWDGIWAAGDVTMPEDTPYFNWLRSWRQGAGAGSAMAGEEVESTGDVDLLNMQMLGLSLVAIGQTTVAYRSGYTEMRGDYPYGEFYKKLVFDPNDTLVGALLVGSVAEAGALEEAVRLGTQKKDLDPQLLHQMFEWTYRTEYLGVQCPVCRHEIQLNRGAAEGDQVTCPICGVDFTLQSAGRGFVAKIAR